jgi:hypothetical protein
MNISELQPEEQRLDRATGARLAKLSATPVDLSRLDRIIQAEIPKPAPNRPVLWLRPLRMTIAACLMLAIGIATLLIGTSGGPVMASTTEMAQLHDDMVSGRVPASQVDSMQAANKLIAAEWAQSPQMPNVPTEHVAACCMRSVKNKKMACVLLKGEGEPVTMTVANASDMQMPMSPTTVKNGVEYHVQSIGDLNMVMTERQGRLVCLIAKLPVDRLMVLASSMEF